MSIHMSTQQFKPGSEIHITVMGSRVHARILSNEDGMCEYEVIQCCGKAAVEGLTHGGFHVDMAEALEITDGESVIPLRMV